MTNEPTDLDHDELEGPSKSERKRQMHALQQQGLELAELPEAERLALDLPEDLQRALAEYRRIRQREARRRQLQYIGKLMRKVEPESLERQMADKRAQSAAVLQASREADHWRDQLLDGDNATLEAFIDAHPGVDIQRLRQTLRQARKARADGKTANHSRKLFELIRDALNA